MTEAFYLSVFPFLFKFFTFHHFGWMWDVLIDMCYLLFFGLQFNNPIHPFLSHFVSTMCFPFFLYFLWFS